MASKTNANKVTRRKKTPAPEELKAPEPAPEGGLQKAGPPVIGQLEPKEMLVLQGLRQQSENLVNQIGAAEVRKSRLIGDLHQTEGRAQQTLSEIGQRLGIPDGTAWSVTSDGHAILASIPPGSPAPGGVAGGPGNSPEG